VGRVRDDKALLSVLHDDNTTSTDANEVTFGANWHFWLYDLADGTASELPDIDWNAGAAYASVVDGEPQMLVPAGDYASTKLYTLKTDGSVTPRLKSNGWALRIFGLDAVP